MEYYSAGKMELDFKGRNGCRGDWQEYIDLSGQVCQIRVMVIEAERSE